MDSKETHSVDNRGDCTSSQRELIALNNAIYDTFNDYHIMYLSFEDISHQFLIGRNVTKTPCVGVCVNIIMDEGYYYIETFEDSTVNSSSLSEIITEIKCMNNKPHTLDSIINMIGHIIGML
jgi:hypothetical protein